MLSILPTRFEYSLFVLCIALLLLVLLGKTIGSLLKTRETWLGLFLFFAFAVTIEKLALRSNWWYFSPLKILGAHLIGIPIEELALMVLFYFLVASFWETAGDLD